MRDDAPPLDGVLRGEECAASRTYLWVEFLTLFVVLPVLFCFRSVHVPLWMLLCSASGTCLILLLGDPTFDRGQLWNPLALLDGLWRVIGLWLVAAVVFWAGINWLAPERYLDLPREHPVLWFAVMLLYPLGSVYPQNIVYRVFIFHRYRTLFESTDGLIWASALAFCFGHIIFLNGVALLLTLAGGLIFAHTYAKYRSCLLVSVEHALYGCLVFSVGLAQSLYLAALG